MLRRALLPILVGLLAASLLSATSHADPSTRIFIDNVTVTEGSSGTVAATFEVTLNEPSEDEVTVEFATSDETATAPADYEAATDRLTFAPGDESEDVAVLVNGDALDEANETFTVDLSDPVNAEIQKGEGKGTITDDDPQPALSIGDATVTEGDTGTVDATFTVTLAPISGRPVTVDYATADGSATAEADYGAVSETLTFAPGQTATTVTVPVNGDLSDESNETFTVGLSGEENASITDGSGLGTITDDDDPLPTLSIDDAPVTEGNAGTTEATFTVTLSSGTEDVVTVDYATADGSAGGLDYEAASGTLTFAAGDTEETVTVNVIGDALDEDDETFTVGLSGEENATIADGSGLGTITDDDDPQPALSIGDATVTEGNGTATATFTVQLSPASVGDVSVDYATADGSATAGSDYVGESGELTLPAGETTETITVNVIGDALHEDNESFSINLTNASGASLSDAQGLGTITDDDPLPSVAINDVTVTEGDTGTVTASFNVSLAPASGREVRVDFAAADGTATAPADYPAAGGELVFAAGETAKQVTVPVHGDLLDEIDESFTVQLFGEENAAISDGSGLGTILDNDLEPSISIGDATVTEGNVGTVNAVFTVTLAPASGKTVTVAYGTADEWAAAPADYTAVSGTLTFLPGQTTTAVSVPVRPDTVHENNETFLFNLASATNAILPDGQAVGTIVNDDAAPPPPPPPAPLRSPFSPARGARLTAPPLLRWKAVARARHYNVQVFRNGRKVLSAWPARPRLQLKRSWKFRGRTLRFTRGTYAWIVWPNVRGRYARAVVQSNFRVVR
jgi:large repetitive protein